jgi:hypothetical protein
MQQWSDPQEHPPVAEVHVVCSAAAPELGLHRSVRLLLLAGAAVTHPHHDAAVVVPALHILLILGLSLVACNTR